MRSRQVRTTMIIVILVLGLVAYYAYLSGKAKDERADATMTAVESALARNLETDYPPTPKEVMKYYTDLMKCLYSEDTSDEEVDALAMKARELYDADLLAINESGSYLLKLRSEVADYRANKRQILRVNVASSTNVDYYEIDGFSFARLLVVFTMNEDGKPYTQRLIFLLRRDDARRWKIYGWDLEENVDLTGEGASGGSGEDEG